MTTSLKLFFLGTPHIELDGRPVEIHRRRGLALLAYLAITGERQRRDTLTALFWPESDRNSARKALRRDLSELNRSLERQWLDIDREHIGLHVGYWLDVTEFQQLSNSRDGNHADRTAALTGAEELYRDDFLAGFTLADSPDFDDWQFFQTESLRQEFASSLAQLVELLVAQRKPVEAIAYARRWLDLDPLHEPAHVRLMQLYAHTGQRAAALRQYESCRQLLADELDVAPAPETVALYERVRTRQDSPTGGEAMATAIKTVSHRALPTQTTPFIGRTRELADLDKLLVDPDSRLITILGPGGIGKSRLALEVARRHLERDKNRVIYVSLAPLQTAEELPTAIASAAGLPLQQDGRTPEQQLIDYFASRTRILLVLDNVEHLVAEVPLLNEILQAAPGVTMLATSRERLLLSGETVFSLGGMALRRWQSVEDALTGDAVQLFVQGARRIRPHYELTDDQLSHITRICHLVGGMPLGILLAAAWIDLLSPAEIATEISQSLDFLETELRDIPARQRSVRAVFEYTWQRLTEPEQRALMKLAVFRAGFDRAMANTVAGASLQTLSALANKSLLQPEVGGRYTIHELLRQYAEMELEATDTTDTTRAAFCRFFARFLAEREMALKGPGQKAAHREIEAEFENIRVAWSWSLEHGAMAQWASALESLGIVYEYHGRFHEGRLAFARVAERLARATSPQDRRTFIRILTWQARFERIMGQRNHAHELLQQSLAVLDTQTTPEWDSRPERAVILQELGEVVYGLGDGQQAAAFFQTSLGLFRTLGNRRSEAEVLLAMEGVGRNLHGLGSADGHQRQTEEARQLVVDALTIFRVLGDQANIATSLQQLGVTFLTLGQGAEAASVLEECISICDDLGWQGGTWINAIGYLGIAQEYAGRYEGMHTHGQQILTLAQTFNHRQGMHLGFILIGGAALADRQFTMAEEWLQRDVDLYYGQGESGNLAFALTGLALAAYWSGNRIRAQQRLVESLRIAVNTRTLRATVHALLVASLLMLDREEYRQAVELHSLAFSYPFVGNSRWCEDVAGRHVVAATATLPPDELAAAQERGRQRDLWKTVEYLLATFAG